MKASYLPPHGPAALLPAPGAPGCAHGLRIARKTPWLLIGCALGAVLAATGCGKQSLAIHDSDSFKTAPAEVKGIWQTAVAAARTNGYLCAYTNLQTLQAQSGLTPDQTKAVTDLFGVVGTRMFNAANQGDPEATKALKAVQTTSQRR